MNILVLSAHPDDDAIGCGGRIRLHTYNHDQVWALYLTSGELGVPGDPLEDVIAQREDEARAAGAILGISHLAFWHEPDGELPVLPELVERVRAFIAEHAITIVYAPHDEEGHRDHVAAARIARAALSPGVEGWYYELWTPMVSYGSTVDISGVINEKIAAIRAHRSQVSRIKFDEAALALARYRGELHGNPPKPYVEIFRSMSA